MLDIQKKLASQNILYLNYSLQNFVYYIIAVINNIINNIVRQIYIYQEER